ncbi:MAG: hypothetical protein JJT88_18705 [Gammaproteobacteria bacterium]|nr:hypothetical protein [Gammaproteobacteria bacterium]
MIARIALGVVVFSACVIATAALQGQSAIDVMALEDDGVGPMRLGRDFDEAERLAFRLARESAFSGMGCAGFAEIRYLGTLGEHPVAVMAMTGSDRIEAVEITLQQPTAAHTHEDCLRLRDRFAEPFLDRYGTFDASWQVNKPVSKETLARTGPVLIEARWFHSGSDCYISARFGEYGTR